MLLTDLLPLRNKILLVRHGESEANVSGVISSDPALSTVQHGLTDVGRAQARAAAETVRELAASADASTIRIYASDFLRTRQTAHELAHALGASTDTVVEDVRLRERYFGDYNGGSADLYHTIWAHDASSAHHTHANCESVAAVRGRVVNLVAELGRTHIGDVLVFVSHGDTLQILQTFFANTPAHLHRSLPHLRNCEVRDMNELVRFSRAAEAAALGAGGGDCAFEHHDTDA